MKDERQEGRADGMEEGRKIPKPDTMAMDAQLGEADTWADKLRTLVRQNKMAAVSAVVIVLMILVAVFAPWVAPYDHLAQSLTERLQDPSAAHWLGTDELGRDVFSRIIFGARISLTIGLVPTLISMAIGTVLGLCAGFYGGKTDFIIMRLADVMLAFPSLLLAMVVMYDAMGVRRETGKQAKLLNSILLENPLKLNGEILQEKLKEYVGHTPLQVMAGAILGIGLSFAIDHFCY